MNSDTMKLWLLKKLENTRMSYDALAKEIKISPITLSKFLKGLREPHRRTLVAIKQYMEKEANNG